jgi:DNA sulfur modification protein DndB
MSSVESSTFEFTALRGTQAGSTFYLVTCPFKILIRLFLFEDQDVGPALRVSRPLDQGRVPSMARYLLEHPHDFHFPAITAGIDGEADFEPLLRGAETLQAGRLSVPMTARLVIIDGQHRCAAIKEALRRNPVLGNESIAVLFFPDLGLRRCQQMAADLNKHAMPMPAHQAMHLDRRDDVLRLASRLAVVVPAFRGLVGMEKGHVSTRSRKLFTLNSLHLAASALLRKKPGDAVSREEENLAIAFWNEACTHVHHWHRVVNRQMKAGEFRRNFIHAHSLVQALAIAGAELTRRDPQGWLRRLARLRVLDWSRRNTIWDAPLAPMGDRCEVDAHIRHMAEVILETLGFQARGRILRRNPLWNPLCACAPDAFSFRRASHLSAGALGFPGIFFRFFKSSRPVGRSRICGRQRTTEKKNC